MSASRSSGLPRGIRFAALVSLVLAALTGWSALSEATQLEHFYESRERQLEVDYPTWMGDKALMETVVRTHFSALEPMREPRLVLMGVLSIACAFVFVAAARMLRPDGLPREGMRKMLGRAALVVAVLRTIDGAQLAVVARRMGIAMAEGLRHLPAYQDDVGTQVASSVPSVAVFASVLGTAIIAGTFALLGQYFRSDSVRDAVLARDPEPEED
ncbi:hypothetical protein JY651_06235 [Pyxidicoccus parkwayensis]|uniref:DUF2975 domain-containing protein n=1 Tax=Pyxidicoccus parkwayensis TaxID=2813578 RepID=A0ABX7P167_9BACT|nr:hypothetical protein [Pyxidicoccus parkwaysis]QSQ24546.1 hypothetical protein JY651_06235 [Pyxidicoccus parkwaysis]